MSRRPPPEYPETAWHERRASPGHDAGVDEGAGEEHEAGRVAAGIADAGRVANSPTLVRVELRQPVDPAIRDAVGGARVEHPDVVAGDEPDCFTRRIVGEAQDHDVGLVEIPAPRLRVLARLLRDLHEGHVLARRDPLPDLESGRARLPVDEHVRHCFEPCPVPPNSGESTAIQAPSERRHPSRRIRVRTRPSGFPLPAFAGTGFAGIQSTNNALEEPRWRRASIGVRPGSSRKPVDPIMDAAGRATVHRADRLRASSHWPIARPPTPAHPALSRCRPLGDTANRHLGQEHHRDTVISHTHPSRTGSAVREPFP